MTSHKIADAEASEYIKEASQEFGQSLYDIAHGLAVKGNYAFIQKQHVQEARNLLYSGRNNRFRRSLEMIGPLMAGVFIPLVWEAVGGNPPVDPATNTTILIIGLLISVGAIVFVLSK